ncbi:MAG: acyltransferase [Acidobacteriota bacterium]
MRIRQLDILRGLAILLVFGSHMAHCSGDLNEFVLALIGTWRRCGWIGVDLFFVLSGFLISGLLFREHQRRGQIRIGRFLIRRAFKIYPAFYVYLAFVVAVRFFSDDPYQLKVVLSEFFFVQNYFFRIFSHSWSLAVEEHFYLGLPLLLLYLVKRCRRGNDDPFRPLVWVFFAVASCLLAFRIFNASRLPYAPETHMYPTHLRIDSLLFGVLLSYWHHYRPERVAAFIGRWEPLMVIGGTLLVMPSLWVPARHPFMHTIGVTCLYVGFGSMMLVALHARSQRASLLRPLGPVLAAIGVYSYSIYLWHLPMRALGLEWARGFAGGPLPCSVEMVIYVAGGIALGIVMSKLVEMPALKLRDRLFPSMSRPVGVIGT